MNVSREPSSRESEGVRLIVSVGFLFQKVFGVKGQRLTSQLQVAATAEKSHGTTLKPRVPLLCRARKSF